MIITPHLRCGRFEKERLKLFSKGDIIKKFLSFVLSLMCVVILSVAASVYVIELKWEAEHNVSKTNRYQLLFGQIRHTTSGPKTGEPGIAISSPSEELACFKFDTVTGETWRYESDFYQDANEIRTKEGFELVREGWNIYSTTQKNKVKY